MPHTKQATFRIFTWSTFHQNPVSPKINLQHMKFQGKLGVPFHAMNLKLSAAVLPQLYVTVGSQHMPLILGKGQKEWNLLFKNQLASFGDSSDPKMWWVGLSILGR